MLLLDTLKRIYCKYLTKLFFHSQSLNDLNNKMDCIIDSHMENEISGDKDLHMAINYTISYRKYERKLINLPKVENITLFKLMYKSIFA